MSDPVDQDWADLRAALSQSSTLDAVVQWWRNASTGEIRGTINDQLYELLDPEDQLWCQLAGIVQVDPTRGRLPTNPKYPPGLAWIWSKNLQCWLPSNDVWQRYYPVVSTHRPHGDH